MKHDKIRVKGIFAVILVFCFVFSSCDTGNKPGPKKCTCPNGTEHEHDAANPCCDGEDCTCTFKPKPKDCTCPTKNHLGVGEDCDCEQDTGCACGLKVYGTLSNGIKIYREGAIDDTTMATNVQKVIDGLAALELAGVWNAENVANKIDEIRIMTDSRNTYYKNIGGKLVLGLNTNRSVNQIRVHMANICSSSTLPEIALMQYNNAIRMARVMTFDANALRTHG